MPQIYSREFGGFVCTAGCCLSASVLCLTGQYPESESPKVKRVSFFLELDKRQHRRQQGKLDSCKLTSAPFFKVISPEVLHGEGV